MHTRTNTYTHPIQRAAIAKIARRRASSARSCLSMRARSGRGSIRKKQSGSGKRETGTKTATADDVVAKLDLDTHSRI